MQGVGPACGSQAGWGQEGVARDPISGIDDCSEALMKSGREVGHHGPQPSPIDICNRSACALAGRSHDPAAPQAGNRHSGTKCAQPGKQARVGCPSQWQSQGHCASQKNTMPRMPTRPRSIPTPIVPGHGAPHSPGPRTRKRPGDCSPEVTAGRRPGQGIR